MAWWNNLGDLAGDVKAIATGHNPMNNAPPVAAPPTGPGLPVAGSPTPGTHSTGSTAMASGNPGTGWIDPDTGADVPAGTPGAIPSDSGGITGGDSGGGLLGTAENVGGDILGFLKNYGGDIASGIAAFAKKYGTTALEAYNVYQAAQRQAQADAYSKDALARSTSAYDAKSGLRSSGISGLMNPGATVPDLSKLQSLAGAKSGNPFARGGALPVAPPNPMQQPGVAQRSDVGGALPNPSQQLTLPVQSPPIVGATAVPGANLPPGAQSAVNGTVGPTAGPVAPPVNPTVKRTIPFAPPTDRTDDPSLPAKVMY